MCCAEDRPAGTKKGILAKQQSRQINNASKWATHLTSVCIDGECVQVMIPDAADTAAFYQQLPEGERYQGFWTRIWPSARLLSHYIIKHPGIIKGKIVWEIAAGLGLPSLFAAKEAAHVICSDNNLVAVDNMMDSARSNGFDNFESMAWDFTDYDSLPEFDVMLISDANYDSQQNPQLAAIITDELKKGRTVVLSTPNRISGMGFLDPFMEYCVNKETGEEGGVFELRWKF